MWRGLCQIQCGGMRNRDRACDSMQNVLCLSCVQDFFTKQSAMPSVSESLNIQAASPSCLPASDGGNIGYCVCK